MSISQWSRSVEKILAGEKVRYKLLRRSKHLIYEVETKVGVRHISVSITPSDARTLKNFRSQLRKLIETGKRNGPKE
jgi:hypothetical protein